MQPFVNERWGNQADIIQWDVVLTGGLCKERKVGRKGGGGAAAAGAMITGHFIPHWKTERRRESAGAAAAPVGCGHAAAVGPGSPQSARQGTAYLETCGQAKNEERDAAAH